MAEPIIGMFWDRASAERAMADLQQMGYTQNDISILMSDQTRVREFATDTGSKAAEGAGVGAGIGGTLGVGIPPDWAAQYETDLNAGGILVGVHASGFNAAEVQRVMMRESAAAVSGTGTGAVAGGSVGTGLGGFHGEESWGETPAGQLPGDAEGDPPAPMGETGDSDMAARFPGDSDEDAPPPNRGK